MLNLNSIAYESSNNSVKILHPATPAEKKAKEILGEIMFSLLKAFKKTKNEKKRKKILGQIMAKNFKLVINISNHCLNKLYDPSMDADDLFQEGMIGLISGTKKFNYLRGCRYSTYLWWEIKQGMEYSIKNGKAIRIPVYACDCIAKFKKSKNRLKNILMREPTEEEIKKSLRWTNKRFENITEVMNFENRLFSLDSQTYPDNDGMRLYEKIPNGTLTGEISIFQTDKVVEKNIFQFQLKKGLEKIFLESKLSKTEQCCLREYFYLERTLKKISEDLSISWQRVEQNIKKALSKLRTKNNWERLKDFGINEYSKYKESKKQRRLRRFN
ncbi:MAG: RNA polymerase primary sigma factor [Parcubacteria group bacterium Athens1014_10]|nr:MAG: RNA polymerase primary sigma factor [Parcubacteria group bacterium Athens1014_10]TSD05207.1 MAG: RNA polymerase primary sigma factor [Parcubacteria group bacterium Athens0714_12]